MSKELNDVAPSLGEVSTLYVALEVSGTSWVVGIGDPEQQDKVGMHRLAPADTAGLLERIGKARAGADGPSRVLLTYEAGFEGFWLARWLGEHAPEIDVVICDPASLEVVRRKRRAKTDRIDARKMVRALRAWDGGDRDAMSPVRIPTIEEEDAKRLLRRRERLVKERRRLANSVSGLLRLHGVSIGDPAGKGFRARLDGLETAYGSELRPGLLAEIHGILDRLELVVAELKTVEAEKAAALKASREALDGLAAQDGGDAEPGGIGTEGGTEAAETTDPAPDRAHFAAALVRLRGIGSERRAAPGHRAVIPGLPQPPRAGQPGGTGAGPLRERPRRPRPRDQQGGQPAAAQAPGPDGLALAAVPAGQRAVEMVPGVRQRPRRACAQAGDRGAGAQAAGRAVALRHRRAGAGRRRPVAGLREGH